MAEVEFLTSQSQLGALSAHAVYKSIFVTYGWSSVSLVFKK